VATGIEGLSAKLHRLANELRQVEHQLQSSNAPEAAPLQEFRQALDNTRLTAWSVNEAISAGHRDTGPDSVLSFLAAERLRRLDQMVRNMCADLDRRAVTAQTTGVQSLIDSVNGLMARLHGMAKK
jgi:hypothetical protein